MSLSETPSPTANPQLNDAAAAAPAVPPCPGCGAPQSADPRFPAWCPSCEWNLLPPRPSADGLPPRARRRAERALRRAEERRREVRARSERVFRLVEEGGSELRHGASVGAFLLAGLVHLVSLAVLALGVGLLAGWPVASWPARVLGAVVLAVAFVLRPRLGRPERSGVLSRQDAPALYELVDRVAAELGAPAVDSIAVTSAFNASFGTYGLRRHRQLAIGLPLWTVLTRQQRVALLGHEIGHCVNGDARRGVWTGSAVGALAGWHGLTRPSRRNASHANLAVALASAAVNLVLGAVHLGVRALTELMHRLHLRSGQAAEHRADLMAARLTSPQDAQGMLRALSSAPTLEAALTRQRTLPRAGGRAARAAAAANPAPDLWEALAEAVRSVPPTEVERRMRLSEREGSASDPSHPPTYLRLRLLASAPPADRPPLVLDAGRAAAIEAELAPSRARIAAELR
ncbi:M48 family metalloprotease [Kitasatospora sp. NA04385]|uniref:M48 family metallopeptidase n=1 Tax=Kitasatospora sp. NA04385 TaxID=2742135 RepID=UPI0015928D77|nr:M48 family metallopeptidase [Kitasatospora sp. NA04385]QKW19385.1 M48 family metalloprotease [Kitasatospora sp. NA04385]